MAARKRFYVYRIFDDPAVTLYVGKGSTDRLEAQKRRFRANGEVIEWQSSEKECYRRERHFIALLKPALNKHPGGNGSTASKTYYRRTAEEIEMDRVGTRVYAARALLRKGDEQLLRYIDAPSLARLKVVARDGVDSLKS
jgi:hypothetical protein